MARMRNPLETAKARPDSTAKTTVKEEDEPRPSFTTTSEAYAHDLYRDVAKEEEVDAFLEEGDLYDTTQKKWLSLSTSSKNGLLGCVSKIVSSIVRQFVKPTESTVTREVVASTLSPAREDKKGEKGNRKLPSVVVQATGPSFQVPQTQDTKATSKDAIESQRYSNTATCIVVKLDSELGTAKENVDEMEPHARRIFDAQPNRFFARFLFLTQTHARLVHFDRAGSQVSPLINIHEHPATLIRLVAGLSSADERTLGVDDSIQWTIVDGKKEQGTLTTLDSEGETKRYPILEQIPIPRDSVRGRATTCWRVQDPDTLEQLVVKDTWRPDDRPGEHELLELVKGVRGIVQMVACEPARGETKDLRCPTTVGQYYNRVSTRVVMKAYGKPIESFTSVLQLLCALRDALAGLCKLESDEIRILHRDVSHNNILLGGDDAPEGYRGVLIDLDLAFRATKDQPKVTADYNIGTRTFQSLSLLEGISLREHTPEHDYLDDIESFFYVLCYLFLIYLPDGTRLSSQDDGASLVWRWGERDPRQAFANKRYIFGFGTDTMKAYEVVEKNWGAACYKLFESFLEWMADRREEKIELVYDTTAEPSQSPLQSLHAHRDKHFSTVLTMFDEAIDAVKSSLADTPRSTTPVPVVAIIAPPKVPATTEAPDATPPVASVPVAAPEEAPLADVSVEPVFDSDTEPSAVNVPAVESTAPTTPPPRARPSLPSHPSSPLTPTRKRRSEDGEHPESPRSKAVRVSEGTTVTSRSP